MCACYAAALPLHLALFIGLLCVSFYSNRSLRCFQEQLSRETGRPTDEQVEELRREVSNKCDVQSTAFYSSSQGWDDGVILPQDTRRVSYLCLVGYIARFLAV